VASAPAPVPAAPQAGVAVAPKPDARPPVSSDPLGDLARAKAGGSTADPFAYFVQAGAFRTPEDAEAQRVKLSLLGVEARVTEREQSGRTVYRVRLGPFDSKDAADRAKERMDSSGMDSALVRVQR
jgi:cell division protein FtsN